MKLLFDHNLSPRLVELVADLFPGSSHVYLLGLDHCDDVRLWSYARDHGFAIVSKDADLSELSLVKGFPPKLIWVRLGNCTTAEVHHYLRLQQEVIRQAEASPEIGIVSLTRPG